MKKLLLLITLLLNFTVSYSQSDITDRNPKLKNEILKQSKKGGQLDFFTPIKGHENEGTQIKPGVYETRAGIALIKWGKANYEMGVKTLEEAYSIFSEFKGREINKREREYIKIGYNREI